MRVVPARAAVLGAVIAAIVTLPGLGNGTLWDNSETAYGEVAREILLTHDWVVMHLNGQPWFIQPPLYFWAAALLARIVGVGTVAMRLPAALATIAMGGAIGYATARIAGGRAGTIAAVVLSTSLMQAIVGRLAIMDALLDLFVTAAILWWYRALEPADPAALESGKRSTAFLLGAAALALGTLAKGPVAPVVVVLVIGVWLAWERRSASALVVPRPATLGAALALFLVVTLPWFVIEALRVGPDATRELIGHYTVGRYTGVIENQRGPWWYYVPVLILGFFPWTAFVPVGLITAVGLARERGGAFARLALVWTLVPFVFFSFAQTKLPNYVALVLPALAIVIALWFARPGAGGERRAGIISAATIPLFIGALGFAIAVFIRTNRLEIATGVVAPAFEVLAVVMLAGSLITVLAMAVPRWTPAAPYVLGATAGALVLFIAFIAVPAAETLKPIPSFARTIQALRTPGAVVALRSVSGGNSLVFYTQPGVRSLDDPDADFVALICSAPDVFVITRGRDGEHLVQTATAHGRRASVVQRAARDALVRVDGPTCGPGRSPVVRSSTAVASADMRY
jgi:4-amino-4-deoxy-L-arabinose transferase-like glycosyltransferase